jgi:hypothetical protein
MTQHRSYRKAANTMRQSDAAFKTKLTDVFGDEVSRGTRTRD